MKLATSRLARWAASLSASTALLFAPPSTGRGLSEPVTGIVAPNPQSAAVDDVWALQVNPAGLAFVDAFQLVSGYSGQFTPDLVGNHRLVGLGAFSPFDGFTLGAGGTFAFTPGAPRVLEGRIASALRLGRGFALGSELHAVRTFTGAAPTRWLVDLGMQLRPASWVALGLVAESLGAAELSDRAALRTGLSLRPLGRWLTLGADARVTAGGTDLLDGATYAGATISPSATARLEGLGLALTLGGRLTDLRLGGALNPGYEVGLGLEVNTAHIGAILTSGVRSDLGFEAGAYARLSAEQFESVVPRFDEWLSFTLVGDAVPEQTPDNIVEELLADDVHPVAMLAALERASRDDGITGVAFHLGGLGIGWGRATELRALILRLRDAGKKVVVHINGGDDSTYYVASAADRVYLSPAGGIGLDGLRATLIYVASTLERFGIKAEAVAAGAYKSAPRTFTANEPNAEELEVQNALLDAQFELLVNAVAEARGLEREKVLEIIDMGGLTADEARRENIVDGLCYWSDISKMIESDFGNSKPHLRDDYLTSEVRDTAWVEPERIAVIPVVGEIRMGRSQGSFLSGGGAGAADIIEAIEKAKRDSDVKAVVIRIDSPGGDALASDLIWHAVVELRDEKPVVVSMGDYAASGGYYIAAAGQEIFAEPDTITGSIGVYTLLFQGEQLAKDLDVSVFELQRGALPGPNLFRGATEEEKARIKEHVEWTYERFLTAVKEGRGMSDETVRPVAGGRVWTGAQAKDRGLVDHLGGLDAAIARARELAGVSDNTELELSILTGRDELIPRISTSVSALLGVNRSEEAVRRLLMRVLANPDDLALLESEGRPLAHTPYRVRLE